MELLEAWEFEITRREAVMEVLLHGVSINEFYDAMGYAIRYPVSDLMSFLGY
mgnify:CR=1 FL=1|tara:strand:+ start:3112 stop:3267 length:156 start_codon:yes stop_codon:yes gene_type:complete